MASERTIHRLEAQIQRRIAHCLQFELQDPRASFVTVVRVELNSDLSTAKVFYSVLGDDSDRARTGGMLEHAKGFIRRQVSGVLRTRTTPDLRFLPDDTAQESKRMDDLIAAARRRDEEIRGEDPGAAPGEGDATAEDRPERDEG
ncbi:MAG: 30S ribosome-binding factor RbfA [Planctomycetota bacterium]|nr:30S ribosome-binding factor RbfA [Planctomycetota bacterium]